MKTSVLSGIIQRLEIMTKGGEPEARRFELDGVEKCQVSYDPAEDEFELIDSTTQTSYRFDDLDLVAIEIFDLLA